ncbi:MAG: hypothetical protein CR997_00225 [Acidobacteria bacterium]|nr:MAG: hypothetical protein CR997_00225 [Acidobacteriota bacterium]
MANLGHLNNSSTFCHILSEWKTEKNLQQGTQGVFFQNRVLLIVDRQIICFSDANQNGDGMTLVQS